MTPDDKDKYIKNLIDNGDKRSYNEIRADLELYLWKEKFKQ